MNRRRFAAATLVVASHNPGKVTELAQLLAPFGIELRSAAALGLPEPEETGASFAENAALKARAASRATALPAIADDSGLAVAALDGAPGIRSARLAGPGRDFAAAMARVEQALAGAADRSAEFVCALALAWPDAHCEVFEGRVAGRLVWPPRGGRGFGYDPMFVPHGDHRSFGEMDPAEKDRISHRACAFGLLVASCFADRSGPK